jgi:hypothetical protein
MSDINSRSEKGSAPGGTDRALQSRRSFVQRAALIGLPVVLATVHSRTVWAQPKKPAGTIGTLDASGTGSINPSSSSSQPSSLL